MENKKILFKLSKTGALLCFEVISRKVEDGAVLITRKGQVDGAMQEDLKILEPKNVGRANETTPWQQAELENNSKVNKLLDKGYKDYSEVETPINVIKSELLGSEGTDGNGNLIPMLAQKNLDRVVFPCIAQKKFNGLRCIARSEYLGDGYGVSLRSRRGKFWDTMQHIREDLKDCIPPGLELDGELFHEDFSLQMINSKVKRDQPGNEKIRYRVYDIIGTGIGFKNRFKILQKIARAAGPSIVVTINHTCRNWDDVNKYHFRFLDQGYEGTMLRQPKSLYEAGKRSYNLIKYKPVEDDEFELVGMNEATGRDEGTAIFVLKTSDGKEFRSRPMGTREQRREYLENEAELIGEMVTVKYQELSDDGIPVHSRAVCIRDAE